MTFIAPVSRISSEARRAQKAGRSSDVHPGFAGVPLRMGSGSQPRRKPPLRIALFWIGEVIGGLCVIAIPFLLLFLGGTLQ